MSHQHDQFPPVLQIPQPDGLVQRPAEHAATIGRKRHTVDYTLMPAHDGKFLTALRVPQPHRLVIRSAQHAATIGRIRYAGDLILMPAHDDKFLTALRVPQTDSVVGSSMWSRPTENAVVIARKCHNLDSRSAGRR